jgi:hypothetical protein
VGGNTQKPEVAAEVGEALTASKADERDREEATATI